MQLSTLFLPAVALASVTSATHHGRRHHKGKGKHHGGHLRSHHGHHGARKHHHHHRKGKGKGKGKHKHNNRRHHDSDTTTALPSEVSSTTPRVDDILASPIDDYIIASSTTINPALSGNLSSTSPVGSRHSGEIVGLRIVTGPEPQAACRNIEVTWASSPTITTIATTGLNTDASPCLPTFDGGHTDYYCKESGKPFFEALALSKFNDASNMPK